MAKITIQFDSVSEMESFRSQRQTAQEKTTLDKVYLVVCDYDESSCIMGGFTTNKLAQQQLNKLNQDADPNSNYYIRVIKLNSTGSDNDIDQK